MTTRRLLVNIASANAHVSVAELERLESAAPQVPVFCCIEARVVGHCSAFRWIPPDLWAFAELDSASLDNARAASVISVRDGCVEIHGVILTTMSRELIGTLGKGLSYEQAVKMLMAQKGGTI